MIRLFIALTISAEIKLQLDSIIQKLQSPKHNIKWVKPENLHLTVKFIGNCEQSQVSEIVQQVSNTTANFTPIESNFTKLGGFPNLIKPRVIWIDIEKNREKIISLAKSVDQCLTQIGFEPDHKAFKPHLTLGRVKENNSTNSMEFLQETELKEISLIFNSLELIHSTLTQRGPIYKTLHTIKFTDTFSG